MKEPITASHTCPRVTRVFMTHKTHSVTALSELRTQEIRTSRSVLYKQFNLSSFHWNLLIYRSQAKPSPLEKLLSYHLLYQGKQNFLLFENECIVTDFLLDRKRNVFFRVRWFSVHGRNGEHGNSKNISLRWIAFYILNYMTSRMTLIASNYSISRSIYCHSLNQSSYPRHVKSRSQVIPEISSSDVHRCTFKLFTWNMAHLWSSCSFQITRTLGFEMVFRDTYAYFFRQYCYIHLQVGLYVACNVFWRTTIFYIKGDVPEWILGMGDPQEDF